MPYSIATLSEFGARRVHVKTKDGTFAGNFDPAQFHDASVTVLLHDRPGSDPAQALVLLLDDIEDVAEA